MVIKCEERYNEAMEFAEKIGDKSLQDCLNRLKSWERDGLTIYLYKDFAPYSFYFEEMREDGTRSMNGGLIYHGNPDQSRSFQIEPSTGWEIHT